MVDCYYFEVRVRCWYRMYNNLPTFRQVRDKHRFSSNSMISVQVLLVYNYNTRIASVSSKRKYII